jgi:hypothetical protein
MCSGSGQAAHDRDRREANQAFRHAQPILLGLMDRHTFLKKGMGPLDIAQMQAGMSQILQRRSQITRGAKFA